MFSKLFLTIQLIFCFPDTYNIVIIWEQYCINTFLFSFQINYIYYNVINSYNYIIFKCYQLMHFSIRFIHRKNDISIKKHIFFQFTELFCNRNHKT